MSSLNILKYFKLNGTKIRKMLYLEFLDFIVLSAGVPLLPGVAPGVPRGWSHQPAAAGQTAQLLQTVEKGAGAVAGPAQVLRQLGPRRAQLAAEAGAGLLQPVKGPANRCRSRTSTRGWARARSRSSESSESAHSCRWSSAREPPSSSVVTATCAAPSDARKPPAAVDAAPTSPHPPPHIRRLAGGPRLLEAG